MVAVKQIGQWTFTWKAENNWYECKGPITYDDEHDEIPDPDLWKAAMKLEQSLLAQDYKASAHYSEKGWVEVMIIN